jgi:hypothetical protein
MSVVSVVGRQKSVRRADHSDRGVLPSVVCLSVIVKLRRWWDPGPLRMLSGRDFISLSNGKFGQRFCITYLLICIP